MQESCRYRCIFTFIYIVKSSHSKCCVCILIWLADTKCRLSILPFSIPSPIKQYIIIDFSLLFTPLHLLLHLFFDQHGLIHANSNISQMYLINLTYTQKIQKKQERDRKRSTVKRRGAIIPSVFIMYC